MKETDFILILACWDHTKWKSAYTMEQFARLNRINGCFKYLDILKKEGFVVKDDRGQMSFYLPTEKGKNYILDKFSNANWDQIDLKDKIKEILMNILKSIDK